MKKKFVYGAIILIPLLGGTAARLLRVIIAFTLRDLGVSVFEITVLSATYMLTRALFSPVVGHWADRGAKRHLLVLIGFLGLLVDSQLYLLLPYFGILALRALDGFFGAMVWPTMQALVHFSSPKSMRARIMSGYFVMGSLGMSLGYLLYSYLAGEIVRAIVLLAIVYALEVVLSLAFREVNGEAQERKKEAKDRLGISLFYLALFFGMYMSLGNEVLLFYLAETMGLGRVYATMILFASGVAALLGSLALGQAADKRGFRFSLILLGIMAPVASLLISVNYVPIAIAGTVLFFVAGRGFMPISRSFTASESRKIGTSLGYVNLASNMGSVVALLLGGAFLDYAEHVTIGVFNLAAASFVVIGAAILVTTLWFERQFFRGSPG